MFVCVRDGVIVGVIPRIYLCILSLLTLGKYFCLHIISLKVDYLGNFANR